MIEVFIEFGAILLGLAIVARLSNQLGFSPIPFYLLLGVGLTLVGFSPQEHTADFIEIGAEIGIILLLFMLGLEYTGEELGHILKSGVSNGVADVLLNFTPGIIFGFILGWHPIAAILLGGVTYISSSGVIAKVLNDLDWLPNRETPTMLSILVFEDLVMALYLPIVVVLIVGADMQTAVISLTAALAAVAVILFCAIRFGEPVSNVLAHKSNEVVLLTAFGAVLLVAGIAQQMQISSAVGAFLVGIGLSGTLAEQAREIITPLRDLFAATFFISFGLHIDPTAIPPVLLLAVALAIISGATKILTGWWAAKQAGVGSKGRWRAGVGLIARGEFSIVIAGLAGTALEPQLAPLAAAYVLLMALSGPILTRVVEPIWNWNKNRRAETDPSTS
jgi:CPA2 family monovalent cation:H+ antiporter-2